MLEIVNFGYLASAIGFITGIKLMATPSKAKIGNYISAVAMVVAIVITVLFYFSGMTSNWLLLLLGAVLIIGAAIGRIMAYRFEMTKMPELVSLFNAFGGLSATIIAITEGNGVVGVEQTLFIFILMASALLGSASFAGSMVAYFKLGGALRIKIPFASTLSKGILIISIVLGVVFFWGLGISPFLMILILSVLGLVYGFLFAIVVGGADMPVLISLLNSITGIVTALSGVLFESPIMLLGGVLVGATGVLLTIQMCNAMNRSLLNVLSGKSKSGAKLGLNNASHQEISEISAPQTAALLAFSKKVAVVPGFGLAVSQAQKLCFEIQQLLAEQEVELSYIIHPVAGRMPGHMNVLLAEANIQYESIVEMADVNQQMNEFDAVLIIGANDVVNPDADDNPDSPIYGMPIIKAHNAKQVVVLKRGMSTGYSGINNPLFEKPNCKLLFGDAKASLQQIINELKML